MKNFFKSIAHLFTLILNLQLFANPNTNVTTDSALSPEMKTFYSMDLIENMKPNLVHGQFGQKKPIPKNGGKKIEFRKYSSFPKALVPLTEGVTPDGRKLSVSKIEAEIQQYGDYVTYSDILDMTAIDNNVLEATKLLGDQAGLTLDTIDRTVLQSGTNVRFCSAVTAGGETSITKRIDIDETCKLTVKEVEKAATQLKADNVPKINGYYIAIIHPYVSFDLRRDPEFIEAHKYAQPEELYEGEIGKIGGVRFIETTEAKIYNGKDLASDTRTLQLSAAATAASAVSFDGSTAGVAAGELVGRWVLIGTGKYYVGANTTTQMTLYTDATKTTAASVTAADNTVIYPGEGGKAGKAVFGNLFMGADAYGITAVDSDAVEVIVKPLGSAGTADPLNQRGTIGWKANRVAEILRPEALLRVESGSNYYEAAEN